MLRKPWLIGALLILIMLISVGCAVTCRPAEYMNEQQNECCPMCSSGNRVHKHCTEFSSTSCIPCIEGTFLDKPSGLKQCFSCANCDTGTGLNVKRSCTTTSDAVCEPLEGFYCVDRREDGCIEAQRHDTCKPGQYVSQRGTSSTDNLCMDCTGDTYSNGTFTTCRRHTDCESLGFHLIEPGNNSSDSTCEESSNSKTIVVPVVVVLVVLVIIAGLYLRFQHIKKSKKDFYITDSEGRRNIPQQETLKPQEPSQPETQI